MEHNKVSSDQAPSLCLSHGGQEALLVLLSSHYEGSHGSIIGEVVRKPNSTERLIGWSIKLSEFDFAYKLWKVIKGQALVDFVAEFVRFPYEEVTAPKGKT